MYLNTNDAGKKATGSKGRTNMHRGVVGREVAPGVETRRNSSVWAKLWEMGEVKQISGVGKGSAGYSVWTPRRYPLCLVVPCFTGGHCEKGSLRGHPGVRVQAALHVAAGCVHVVADGACLSHEHSWCWRLTGLWNLLWYWHVLPDCLRYEFSLPEISSLLSYLSQALPVLASVIKRT